MVKIRKNLNRLMMDWDDAVCSGSVGAALGAAGTLVAEIAIHRKRPSCAPGLWYGFIDWCEERQIDGATKLREVESD